MAHALAEHLRTQHLVRQVRPFPTPETVRRSRGESPRGHGTVVSLPSWPTSTPRDGLSRVGAIAPIDGQNRVQAKKVLKGMSWLGTSLVVTVHGRSVTVSPGRPSGPHQSRMRVDSAGRLTLPSHVLAALTVRAGEQVVLAGVPEAQVLNLKAAADVLQGITGPMSLGVQEDEAPSPAQQPTGTRLARAAYADYSRSGD